MDWASFNDRFRDGLRGGVSDVEEKGFLFGQYRGQDDHNILQCLVMGSLREYNGQYIKSAHSVNYLECHDNHTFGDRLRITGGFVDKDEKITNTEKNVLVQDKLLAMNKLGALFLFTSQGITFIHEGQEWARSKVVVETTVPDEHVGKIDHNSYEKDNETNWLNWNEREMNRELVDYYKGLIELRKQYSEFRHSKPEDFEFMDVGEKVAVAYILKNRFVVILNGENEDTLEFDISADQWNILADEKIVNLENQQFVSNKIIVPPSSGIVLKRN
jgi:pullulanase/glycogen debranching enzyme